jgi:hypothetical protein
MTDEKEKRKKGLKIFFLLLPLLIILILFLWQYGTFFIYALPIFFVPIFIGLAVYYLILGIIWKIISRAPSGKTKPVEQLAPVKSKQNVIPLLIIFIFLITVYILFQKGYINSSHTNVNPGSSSHTYGTPCTSNDGRTGLYNTKGSCAVCSSGVAVTSSVGSCSSAVSGVYCCKTASVNVGGGKDRCAQISAQMNAEAKKCGPRPSEECIGGGECDILGIPTYLECDCPPGTSYSPEKTVIDRVTPGGPWKICMCNGPYK